MARNIISVQGIGDLVWLFMKLVNQKEKFNWKVSESLPQRAKPLFDLFPQLVESFEYIPGAGYKTVKRNSYHGLWSRTPNEFWLEANSTLEAGIRIEAFLPDLETSFILDYKTEIESEVEAEILLQYHIPTRTGKEGEQLYTRNPDFNKKLLIGIYTTSYSNSRYMSGWLIDEWYKFLQLILKRNPDYKFIFIGAEYDMGLSDELMKLLPKETYVNAMNQALPVTIEILKRLEMFVGFQSGLSIINETIGAKQTIMLYSLKLEAMMETWADKKRIESGQYKGCHFGDAKHPLKPEQLIDWMIEYKKI